MVWLISKGEFMKNSMLDFNKSDKTLRISITHMGLEYIEESKDKSYIYRLGELLEWHVSNGWTWLTAEQLGALTSCELILSDDVEIDDAGDITSRPFTVYWFNNYQVENPFDSWKSKGYIDLIKA